MLYGGSSPPARSASAAPARCLIELDAVDPLASDALAVTVNDAAR
jgi:hypothetical protein